VQQLNVNAVEVLSFLFMLGSLTLGTDYSTATLTETQAQMLLDLRDMGIIYQRKSNSRRFYPTRLATTLTSDAGALRSVTSGLDTDGGTESRAAKGFIVIETNYRLYAYTSSTLQIAVLSLFTKMSTRFPDMVSGRITRESIRSAIRQGITADQIITYLTTHAHAEMVKELPILPPTVVDQIRLWQIEGERMAATTGFLFRDFASRDDYEAAARYADEVGVLVRRFDRSMRFFVSKHEQIAAFLKVRREDAKSSGK
jgi:transcription initiation factor TFIIH subunit 4